MARRHRHEQETDAQWPHNRRAAYESPFPALDEKTAPAMATMLDATEQSFVDTEPAPIPFFGTPAPSATDPEDVDEFDSVDAGSLVDIPSGTGLEFEWGVPRQPLRDVQWAATLRRFGRAVVWVLPVGVIGLTLSTVWGWPTPTREPSGASPGAWLAITALGCGLWLIGLTGISALLATSPGRIWSAVAVIASIVGATLLLPVIGVIGLARPAVGRTSGLIGTDAAQSLQAQFLDGTVGRWLTIGGGTLLGVGAVALAGAILAADVLNRLDGWFVLIGVGVAAAGAYLSWEFLLTIAGMAFLAAALGVAWNASRLTADGRIADTD
jgi:hypothetical protein